MLLDTAIQNLFDSSASAVVAKEYMLRSPAIKEEAIHISDATLKRQREFFMGRAASRLALSHVGCVAGPILVRADRTPIWPNGFIGSISHCDGLCLAVAASKKDYVSIGVDCEPERPLPRGIGCMVFNQVEIAKSTLALAGTVCSIDTLIFSAKEAFYKCYYQMTSTFLDFHDVVLSVAVTDTASGTFRASIINLEKPMNDIGDFMLGRWCVAAGFLITSVGVKADALQFHPIYASAFNCLNNEFSNGSTAHDFNE